MEQVPLDINLETFMRTYFYRQDLHDYCKSKKLPCNLTKAELEKVIVAYLSGSVYDVQKTKSNSWTQDVLALNAEVTTNYRSNQVTRDFFVSIIGPKFRFCGAMMKYKLQHPDQKVIYQELVDIWYREQENKKAGNPTGHLYFTANRYNKFVQDFYRRPDNKGKPRNQMITAWKEYKNSGRVNEEL